MRPLLLHGVPPVAVQDDPPSGVVPVDDGPGPGAGGAGKGDGAPLLVGNKVLAGGHTGRICNCKREKKLSNCFILFS